MNGRFSPRALVNLAGAVAVAALIWFAGPLVRIAANSPLEEEGARVAAILFVFALIAGAGFYRSRRRRAAGAFAGNADRFARLAALTGVAAASTLALAAFSLEYLKGREEIRRTEQAASAYRSHAGLAGADVVGDHDLGKALKELDELRALSLGVADRAAKETGGGLGWSQAERLRSAAETAYRIGLERLLRPRLAHRLEEQLETKASDPEPLFEPLRVYLMLGGLETVDRPLVTGWMERDWSENLYPGRAASESRLGLARHLRAMLDLDDGRGSYVSLNGPLVEKTQLALAQLDVARRAYRLLAEGAKAASRDDWTARKAGGPGAPLIFDDALEEIRIPYFLTRSGFEGAFLERLAAVCDQMERDRRVLGPAGAQPAVQARYDRLQEKIVNAYVKAFVDAWRGGLEKLNIRSLTAERPLYPLMAAAAAPGSPIVRIFESVRDETLLPSDEGGVGADASEPSSISGEDAGSGGEAAARLINAELSAYHRMVEGLPGRRPIDALMVRLSQIREDLSRFAVASRPEDRLRARIAAQSGRLRSDSSTLPPPFARMFAAAADSVDRELAEAAARRAR